MQHIAIMKKSWKLLPKILTGQKTIESRWYMSKAAPWDKIKAGETVYFKDSGEPVTVKAVVEKVLQFENLTPVKVKAILDQYAGPDGICIADVDMFYQRFRHKNYCMLIFLKNPEKLTPFNITKQGFGLMSAWLCVDNIDSIKI